MTAEADDDWAWEKPIRVRRPKGGSNVDENQPHRERKERVEDVLSRLIVQQGVTPIDDLDQLGAMWPADDDPDALMNFVLSERQTQRR